MKECTVMTRDYAMRCPDGHSISLDIFAPRSFRQDRTGILFVHGGGFVGGDKDQFLGAASFLSLTEDVVCVTLQYRTAYTSPYPAAVLDTADAIAWMRDHSGELGIDRERIIPVGGSPGANIILLASNRVWLEKYGRKDAWVPSHAVLLNGIYDMSSFWEGNKAEHESVRCYLNFEEDDREEALREASPMEYPYKGQTFDLLHGEEDEVVPFAECVKMADKLTTDGSSVRIFSFRGKGHAWFNDALNQYDAWECIARCISEK